MIFYQLDFLLLLYLPHRDFLTSKNKVLLKVEGGESYKVPIGKWISIKIFLKFKNLQKIYIFSKTYF
jgi:hypothetical protein